LTRPKPLLLLAYLTLNGPTNRRELVETFFRDADDARDSLSTTLGHLRRAGTVERLPDDRLASRVGAQPEALPPGRQRRIGERRGETQRRPDVGPAGARDREAHGVADLAGRDLVVAHQAGRICSPAAIRA